MRNENNSRIDVSFAGGGYPGNLFTLGEPVEWHVRYRRLSERERKEFEARYGASVAKGFRVVVYESKPPGSKARKRRVLH